MIAQTFIHVPGVGHTIERKLWASGFRSWDDVLDSLRATGSVASLFQRQRLLPFDDLEPASQTEPNSRTLTWIKWLDRSQVALQEKNYRFFVDALRPSDRWRILPQVSDDALYLDIETTGLSRDHHYATVIGALFRGQFYQWVWPESPRLLSDIAQDATAIVTFNGERFDLPFLRRQIPSIRLSVPHIDLVHIARSAGLRGGQKALEAELGFSRPQSISDVDGELAVAMWCGALYGDEGQYKQLLEYNRADVVALPQVALALCERLRTACGVPANPLSLAVTPPAPGKEPPLSSTVISAWRRQKPRFEELRTRLNPKYERAVISVGIDLRASKERPTGWAVCRDIETETRVLHSDEEIISATLACDPDIVSIDAPLFLPRGRTSVSDDSPCRESGGIVRDAERILWSRGIRVYPALIRQMQGLTRRGISIAQALRKEGLKVIESYPGAAQDLLNIPRKQVGTSLLALGLSEFGYRFPDPLSHDELDAITSALVGHYYLAGTYEEVGSPDEGFMIVPEMARLQWNDSAPVPPRVLALVGPPGAGKTTLAKALSSRLGWDNVSIGEMLRERMREDPELRDRLSKGELAPEPIVLELVSSAVNTSHRKCMILDGFPRHGNQVIELERLGVDWRIVSLEISDDEAIQRLVGRRQCANCGYPAEAGAAECRHCKGSEWVGRDEDRGAAVEQRLRLARQGIEELRAAVPAERLVCIDSSQPSRLVANEVLAFLDT